jgi:hypothetical protein
MNEFKTIAVTDLMEGDYIVNVGTVNAPIKREGVFVLAETYAPVWSIFTGRGTSQTTPHVWHETFEVTIEP